MNVVALSRNPVGPAMDDDDFSEEIQDIGNIQTNTPKEEGEVLSIQTSKEIEWLDFRRKDKGLL
jgi:hypothetical protein